MQAKEEWEGQYLKEPYPKSCLTTCSICPVFVIFLKIDWLIDFRDFKIFSIELIVLLRYNQLANE